MQDNNYWVPFSTLLVYALVSIKVTLLIDRQSTLFSRRESFEYTGCDSICIERSTLRHLTQFAGGEGRGTHDLFCDGSLKGLSILTALAEMLSSKLAETVAAGVKLGYYMKSGT